MSDTAPHHPDIDIMSAFIEGKLAPEGIAEVAAHLRGCIECRTIVSEPARLERETRRAPRGSPRRTWWLAAAAAVVVMVGAVPLLRWNEQRRSPMARLIAAAPLQHRTLVPRIAGFPWARVQAPARGGAVLDPGDMRL